MSASQPSISARISAFARAYHHQHDQPLVFRDPLASQLFSAEERNIFEENLAKSLSFFDAGAAAAQPDQKSALRYVMRNHVAPITLARSRYSEEALQHAIEAGARQYVLLGAGFDTFVFRRPDLAAKVQVFEVDDPATQDEKLRRIRDAGCTLPSSVRWVPLNFTMGDLTAALYQAGFVPQAASFFSLLGVSYYLPREVLASVFQSIATLAGKGSTLVFDYFDVDAFDDEKASPRMQRMRAAAAFGGEPMLTGLVPSALSKEMGEPLMLRDAVNPEQMQARYFDGSEYRMVEHVHFATAEIC
jgi:methyltransferase (TIGR00027 family)